MEQMTKSFPVFDCDAHINDYLTPWEKYYTDEERELAKEAYWNHGDHILLNGSVIQPGRSKDRWFIMPNFKSARGGPRMSFIDFQGPGMTKKTLRKLNEMDLTAEQLGEIAHRGSIEPLPRLKDMDLMGIDQVLVIPIRLLGTSQWIRSARGANAVLKAYNSWVKYDYCDAAPDRLFPCGLLTPQDPYLACHELRRLAKLDFRVASIRPIDALGKYPNQPVFDPLWRTFQEVGVVCGVHTVTAGGQEQSSMYSPGELVEYAVGGEQIQGSSQTLSFIYEAMTWITGVLLSGFLERYPRLKMAIFESNASWLSMVLEGCDRAYHLYGSQRLPRIARLPSQTFLERCLIAFESDEEAVFRRHDYFRNIGIWSSDAYHHDGSDAWTAIESMRKFEVPEDAQAKLMGGNARRFYGLEDRAKLFTTTMPDYASLPRPPWFPSPEEIRREYARAGEPRAGLP